MHKCPTRTTPGNLLLRKEEIRQIPDLKSHDVSLLRRPACQNLSKAVNVSSATARVAPDLPKALAILSDAPVRRSAVD